MVVKVLDPKPGLFQGKIAVMRVVPDLGIAEPAEAAALCHDWPETLETGAAKCWVLYEQEIAAPEALSRHGPVGLAVNGEEEPAALEVCGMRFESISTCP